MPERWYELLRERMQVEQLRMRIVKDARLVENDLLQQLLAEAHNLDALLIVGAGFHDSNAAASAVWACMRFQVRDLPCRQAQACLTWVATSGYCGRQSS
jgi:hypothetical protein